MVNQIIPITAGEIRSGRYSGRYNNSFNRLTGISLEGFSEDKCAITVTPQETALNVQGCVHGGYIATVADTVASGAAYSDQIGALKDGEYGLTASLSIEFNKPLFAGKTYFCEGKIDGREGNNIRTNAIVTDDQGVQVAAATALVKARRTNYVR